MLSKETFKNWYVHGKKNSDLMIRFGVLSFGSFLFDLSLLWVLTDFVHIQYLLSAIFSFLIAITLEYIVNRLWTFANTERGFVSGYLYFVTIALIGILCVLIFMPILVEIFHFSYLTARIIVACFTGIWNYVMNLIFNFKFHNL